MTLTESGMKNVHTTRLAIASFFIVQEIFK